MAGINLDFKKTPSEQRVTVWIAPAGAIANFDAPTAAEINAMHMASASISWNDYDFGLQASSTLQDPSLADITNYTDFGAANYGGSMSFYYPKDYDDASNLHSVVYDMTDKPWTELEVVVRIDGDVKTSVPAQDGDMVSVYSVLTDSESNSLQGEDALRRTVGMLQQGAFAHRVPVGSHEITVTPEAPTVTAGKAVALEAKVQGRVFTNGLEYRSENPEIAVVSPAGVVKGVSTGSTTITVADPGAGTSTTVTVTVQ